MSSIKTVKIEMLKSEPDVLNRGYIYFRGFMKPHIGYVEKMFISYIV
jgi:hypothetical protein